MVNKRPTQLGKILVVDDEEIMRRSLADILRQEGYQVHMVASGEAAVNTLRTMQASGDSFDVILLDLKMPGMDGLDVLRVASNLAPDTLVILLAEQGSLESAIEAIRYRAHDYLLKPVTSDQIINSVTKAISRRADQLHKRAITEQLSAYRPENKGGGFIPNTEPGVFPLSEDVMVDLARRVVWRETGNTERKGTGKRSPTRKQPGEVKVHLTPTEARLLRVLLENRGRVLTHRELVMLVQGYEVTHWEAPEVLRPLVSRLRQKLQHFPGGDSWIVNVRGTGYVLERRQKDRGPSDGIERRQPKSMG